MIETTDMLCKDAFGISSRLFDHRAIVKAECKYIVNELELKRNRDTFKFIHDVVPISQKTGPNIEECIDLMEQRIQKVHDLVISSVSSSLDILSTKSEQYNEKQEEYQKKRDKEWAEFVEEMNKAREEVCEKHNVRMAELQVS